MRKFYAAGEGETRSSERLLTQAEMWSDPVQRLNVVKRMYGIRFPDLDCSRMSIEQIRGIEGARTKSLYRKWAQKTGVPWNGRIYKVSERQNKVNAALTLANDLLYAVCHAAIVSLGYSPAIGFVHTGQMRSFVFDIADLYKQEITIPAAFTAASGNVLVPEELRLQFRTFLSKANLMKRLPKNIGELFNNSLTPTMEYVDGETLFEQNQSGMEGSLQR